MKRIITLMMALALVFGAVANSSAADIKAKGLFNMEYVWMDNTNFADSDADNQSEDDFVAQQRFRTQIDITANENLKGVVYFEIDNKWGDAKGSLGKHSGGGLGADGVNIETKRAYIDWTVPNTAMTVRMGLQGLALPATVAGSTILDDDVAAVVSSYKFNDMFSLTGFWARPFDTSEGNDSTSFNAQDEMDIFGLIAGIKLDGVEITPWAAYAAIGQGVNSPDLQSVFGAIASDSTNTPAWTASSNWGNATKASLYRFNGTNSEDNADAYWLGLSTSVTLFDPIVFSMDAVYGSVDTDFTASMTNATTAGSRVDNSTRSDSDILDRAGWMVAAKLSYKMDMMTPGIMGWYASGEDDDITNGSERLPVISGGFAPTSFGFNGGANNNIRSTSDFLGVSGEGKWATGLLVEDIKVIDSLTSQLRVLYVEGTNDADFLNSMVQYTGVTKADFLEANIGKFMTDKDSAWEVNFDHKYDIYENLALIVEMGYINMDLDESTWGINGNAVDYDEDAYKLGFIFQYKF